MAKKERKFDRRGLISYCAFGLVVMLLTYLIVCPLVVPIMSDAVR